MKRFGLPFGVVMLAIELWRSYSEGDSPGQLLLLAIGVGPLTIAIAMWAGYFWGRMMAGFFGQSRR